MRTSVTELPDSRVRVDVDVDADAVEHRLESTAKAMGRELRIPGFRKGKVPAGLVIQRIGREAVLEEAVRDSLGEWYERALGEAGVTPVGDPKLDLGELPAAGEDLRFSIEIGVRPRAELGEYRGLEVGRAAADVPEEAINAELDRLREALASLSPVEREADAGDLVVIDYAGTIEGEPFEGGEAKDLMIELGREGLLPEMDAALQGAAAGAELEVEVTFPDDYRPDELAGKSATFAVTLKEVREKHLPELDDEFASEASEFDTLEELREAIAERLGELVERRAESAFRDAAIDAAAEAATVEIPDEILDARAEEMLDRFLHQLSHRGVDPEAFIKLQEGGKEGMLAGVREDAARGLRREATLAAIAEAEAIDVSTRTFSTRSGPARAPMLPNASWSGCASMDATTC